MVGSGGLIVDLNTLNELKNELPEAQMRSIDDLDDVPSVLGVIGGVCGLLISVVSCDIKFDPYKSTMVTEAIHEAASKVFWLHTAPLIISLPALGGFLLGLTFILYHRRKITKEVSAKREFLRKTFFDPEKLEEILATTKRHNVDVEQLENITANPRLHDFINHDLSQLIGEYTEHLRVEKIQIEKVIRTFLCSAHIRKMFGESGFITRTDETLELLNQDQDRAATDARAALQTRRELVRITSSIYYS